MMNANRKQCAAWLLVAILGNVSTIRHGCSQPPVDVDWKANAVVDNLITVSDERLGAAQGVSYREGRLYFYGDVYRANPRVGIIREYTLDLKPTGRDIRLARNGKPLLLHPTGLTWDEEFGCFLGDTVNKVATIYKLDWQRGLHDGNLDAAVLAVIRDDAAINGCRPEFVSLKGRRLLATADYGDVRPAVRLYDPRRLVAAGRSLAPGVCVAAISCGSFNQNLAWDSSTGQLTCVQNVVAGIGWKLDVFDLQKVLAGGLQLKPARVQTLIFAPHSELEGWLRLPDGREVFVTSSPKQNIYMGKSRPVAEFAAPKGTQGFAGKRELWYGSLPYVLEWWSMVATQ